MDKMIVAHRASLNYIWQVYYNDVNFAVVSDASSRWKPNNFRSTYHARTCKEVIDEIGRDRLDKALRMLCLEIPIAKTERRAKRIEIAVD